MNIKNFKDVRNLLIIFITLIGGGYFFFWCISYVTYSKVKKVKQDGFVFIPTDATIEKQAEILFNEGFIQDTAEYLLFTRKMNVKPRSGHFEIYKDMSFKELHYKMRWGDQTPVIVKFNDIWDREMLAGVLSKQIELDSIQIMETFANDTLIASLDISKEEAFYMFLPDMYQFYWNMSGKELLARMKYENDNFWSSEKRQQQLKYLGLTINEVRTLASIVQRESSHQDEMRIIAGIYLNRIKKRMPLQACPTVKFALDEPSLRRITNKHLEVDSPYNTYKNLGLPPSPIGLANKWGLDAVLNYTPSNYLFFCAKPELDGRHRFAKTYSEHSRNAREYANMLNKAGIK